MATNWLIGDTAIALFDIFLEYSNEKGKRSTLKLVEKDSEHTVRDVKTYECMKLININVEYQKEDVVIFTCLDCRVHHVVKKSKEKVIFFPSIWFIKPEMKVEKESIKEELIKNDKGPKPLKIRLDPTRKTTPKEVPHRIHEKECNIKRTEFKI